MTIWTFLKSIAEWLWNNPFAAFLLLVGVLVLNSARKNVEKKAQFGLTGIIYELFELLFVGINIGKLFLWIAIVAVLGRAVYVALVNAANSVDVTNLPKLGDKAPALVFTAATPAAGSPSSQTPSKGLYVVAHSSGSATIRDSATGNELGQLANGKTVNIDQWTPVPCVPNEGSVCFRGHFATADDFPKGGWVYYSAVQPQAP